MAYLKRKNSMRAVEENEGDDKLDRKEKKHNHTSSTNKVLLDSSPRKRKKLNHATTGSTCSNSPSYSDKKKLDPTKRKRGLESSSSSNSSSFSEESESSFESASSSTSLSSGLTSRPLDPLQISGNSEMASLLHNPTSMNQSQINESRDDVDVIASTTPIPNHFNTFEVDRRVLVNSYRVNIESNSSAQLTMRIVDTFGDPNANLNSGTQDAAHSSTGIRTPSTAPTSPQETGEFPTQSTSRGPLSIVLTNPKITFSDEDRKLNKYLDLLFRTRPELDNDEANETKHGEVLGHRMVLEQIPFVAKQLTSEFFDVITVPDLKGSAVEAVVRSFYTNQLELTEDTVESILEVLEKFELLNRIDCWTLRSSAMLHRNDKVVEAVDNYIVKNFSTRSCDFNFLTLPFVLLDYYVAKGVNDKISNTVLLNGILKWASENSEERKEHLYDLIQLLDLGDIFNESPDVLKLAFSPGSLLDSIPSCVQLHNKVLASKAYELRNGIGLPFKEWNLKLEGITVKSESLSPNSRSTGSSSSVMTTPITSPLKSTQGSSGGYSTSISINSLQFKTETKFNNAHLPPLNSVSLLLFPIVEFGTRYLEAFDFTENKAYRLHRMKRPREFSSLIQLKNCIYEIGGSEDGRNGTIWDDITSTNLVDIFKKGVNLSTPGPHLMKKRRVFTCVVVKDAIYIVGGDSKEKNRGQCVSNVVEKLDTGTKLPKWQIISYLHGSRSCHASVTMDDKIYIVGGVGEIEEGFDQPDLAALRSVEVYSLRHETWSRVRPMKIGRRCLRLHVMDHKIYAIGGENPNALRLPVVEVYNPLDDTWEDIAPMNHGRCSFGVLEINGQMHVIGGNSENALELNIEVYNSLEDRWTVLPWPAGLNKHARLISSTTLSPDYVQ